MEFFVYLSIYIGLFIGVYYVINMILYKQEKYSFENIKEIPKVSIIIPAYNEENGIAKTIKSALDIDYPSEKLEIIVVDDGSRDNTYSIALKFASKRVKVLKMKKNSGKGAAMNFAISNSEGEIIVTMDADNTLVSKDVLKKMVPYFKNKEVMCVCPSMLVHKPRTILERIQQIEYGMGVYLRKAFRSVNSVHITPGAFSAYRKEFFNRHGGFVGMESGNLTEDLEMALRIQSNNYTIENVPEAVVYTVVPNKFVALMKQRRRWYGGMLKNFWNYRRMFSKQYGDLGLIVLPSAVISILFAVILIPKALIELLINIKNDLILWQSINYSLSFYNFTLEYLSRFFYSFFGDPKMIFFLILVISLISYLIYSKKKTGNNTPLIASLIVFLIIFTFLFVFWWLVSFVYILFNKKIKWR